MKLGWSVVFGQMVGHLAAPSVVEVVEVVEVAAVVEVVEVVVVADLVADLAAD